MTQYSSDTPLDGINAITNNRGTFALVNKRERTKDGTNTYIADKIPIDNISDAVESIKQYELGSITTEDGFYADDISVSNLNTLLILKLAEALDPLMVLPVPWKKKGVFVESLTVGEIILAVKEGLTKKGEIIGVV